MCSVHKKQIENKKDVMNKNLMYNLHIYFVIYLDLFLL